MIINANTKIAPILKQNPSALNAIISINPKFAKLRNPLLRKVMAGRTTLTMASRFGGCSVDDFYQKLEPLGFEIDRQTTAIEENRAPIPDFIQLLTKQEMSELDVRPIIASGCDPLQMILEKIKGVKPGHALKIINSFEPAPLITMLKKKGFETYVDKIGDDCFETYFYNTAKTGVEENKIEPATVNDWDSFIEKYKDKLQQVDVRSLKMPQPMLSIVEALDHLPNDTALYVFHKRIPVFLLPEIVQRGFGYRIKEIGEGEVHLLIFSN